MVKRDKLGRFVKRSIPWNKRTKGVMKPNKTSFKKGHPYGKRFEKGQSPWNKNKTFEELYGKGKAKKMLKEMSLRNKDKTYEEIYGSKEKVEEVKRKIGLRNIRKKKPKLSEFNRLKKGKNYNEIYGEERAKKIRKKISLGKQNPSEETRKKLRKNRAKQVLPKYDTKIEVKIQNFLKKLGIEFFTHQHMNIKHSYQCDILIPYLNLVIECDGDYWHKYPIGNYIDHIRTEELLEKGFKVLRLWEFEINEISIKEFEDKIRKFK